MKRYFTAIAALIAGLLSVNAQILFEVTGNGLEKPSYLFGTHHLAPLSILTDNKEAMEAFNNVSGVVTEIDMTSDPVKMQMEMAPFMLAPADSTLSKVLSAEDLEKVNKVFSDLTGTPVTVMESFRPTVVAMNISVMTMMKELPGFNMNEQLDTYINGQGVANGKKATALETPAQQAKIVFESTPISQQARALVEMVEDPHKLIESSKKLNEAYFAHDLSTLFSLSMEEEEDPEFMTQLLDKRNADWLTRLPDIMKEGDVFVGVGALHLCGPQGLVEGLRKLGFTVTPIN